MDKQSIHRSYWSMISLTNFTVCELSPKMSLTMFGKVAGTIVSLTSMTKYSLSPRGVLNVDFHSSPSKILMR